VGSPAVYKRLATNTFINMINIAVNIVFGLVLAPLFIHSLGGEVYGIWVFTLSLSVTRGALIVFDFGILSSTVKYVAEYQARGEEQRINEVFSAALLAYLIIGTLVSAGLFILALTLSGALFHVPEGQLLTARILLVILALQTLFDFPAMAVQGLLEGLQRYGVTRGMNIARIIVYAALSLFFLKLGLGVYALALGTFLGELVRLCGHLYWARRAFPVLRVTRHISRSVLEPLLRLSGKMFIFVLTTTIYNQMDQVIISLRLNTTLLTDYDISNRLHTLVFALTTLIGPFVLPAASALHALNDREELHRLALRGTRYTAALTAPAVLIVMVLAKPLTVMWIGPEYEYTVPTTQLFLSYLLIFLLLRVGQNMLIGMNRLRIILPAFILSTLVNLVVSLWTAPIFGVSGVILGTVIGNALACIPYGYAFRRELGMTWHDLWRDIILSTYPQAAIGALTVWGLSALHYPTSLFQVGLYGLLGMTVFGILFILTGMPAVERKALHNLASRLSSRYKRES
jgi:O-antigen/teichoic acid export membrane protein